MDIIDNKSGGLVIMYCKNCGRTVDDTSSYCNNCGARIDNKPNADVSEESSSMGFAI